LGFSNGFLDKPREITTDKYANILLYFPEINPDWLLTGRGSMLKSSSSNRAIKATEHSVECIPLVPLNAIAGYMSGEVQVLEHECERYVVPMFREAEFLIQVKGSSMMPKYNSGDVVACKKLPLNDIFFQWNKVYVLDTAQGALVKRVKKGSDDNHILLVSDNEAYEPFELHKSQIYAIALVIGVIRLE
jgi:phage repressor protein C with HTH and peptisase S24 domain